MPTFTYAMDAAATGCLVKPLWLQFMADPLRKLDFRLRMTRSLPRRPDGWFHASQHPTASEAELHKWLTADPDQWAPGPVDYVSSMSMMLGSMMHAVFAAFLDQAGVAVPLPEGDCPACGKPYRPKRKWPSPEYCDEHGAIDLETRSRCHMDNKLVFDDGRIRGFELKSIRPFGLTGIPDMDSVVFRAKWPKYWGQVQDCMRQSGLREYIVVFLGIGNPWESREFHVAYDPEFAAATEVRYRRVLDQVRREREAAGERG